MPDRSDLCARFIRDAGWQDATRRFLAGDASARRYERLSLRGMSAVLMDAPPDQGEDTGSFVRIAGYLRSIGLSSPAILAQDITNGFLLLEDLGDDVYARLIERKPAVEAPLYRVAVDMLVHLQRNPAPPGLDDLAAPDWANAAMMVLDWYRFAITGERMDAKPFSTALADMLHDFADGPRVTILRDNHAENLLWLPDRDGIARVGVLDFQQAQLGQPGYDLVSLLQDARRDTGPGVEQAMIRHYLDRTGQSGRDFDTSYAALGAQRALRILGIFARLSLVAGKSGYVDKIPRVWGHLRRNLGRPELAGFATLCDELLPEPTPERLERIRAQCGRHVP